jgi:hypothetical protein
MARQPLHAALAAALLALVLAGCGSSSMQSDASSFIAEHQQQAVRVKQGALAADGALAGLANPPTAAQLGALARSAQQGHDLIAHAHDEWVTAEGGAEEILSSAEIEADDGANEMRDALAGLVAYAARPDAGTLARYAAQLRTGREKWDEAVRQIWHLGGRPDPPIA